MRLSRRLRRVRLKRWNYLSGRPRHFFARHSMERPSVPVNEPTIWGIHGGKTGDADSLFLRDHCIAIGWAKVGDLAKVPADREAFKALVARAFPDSKPGAIPNNAGQ